MKRRFALILVFIVAACLCFIRFTDKSDKQEEYCHKLNMLIRDEEFDIAKIQDSKMILYTNDGEQLKEIPLSESNKQVQIAYIRKEAMITYFVLNGAVDDEAGIMFINDKSNEILDGVKSITRIGGNSYRYNTME